MGLCVHIKKSDTTEKERKKKKREGERERQRDDWLETHHDNNLSLSFALQCKLKIWRTSLTGNKRKKRRRQRPVSRPRLCGAFLNHPERTAVACTPCAAMRCGREMVCCACVCFPTQGVRTRECRPEIQRQRDQPRIRASA